MRMYKDRNLNFIIEKLHSTRNNLNIQHFLLKGLATTIQHATKINLQRILELLNITHDMELQVKLLSILANYLMSSDTNIDIIITCNTIYDKIHNVLNRALPRKTMTTLNFVMSLLYVNDKEGFSKRKSLALYARNMIRVSGCLSTMVNLFTDCMIPQDTWRALCRCLSEVCSYSEVNQSYCRHLIPLCVQKCMQGHAEVFSILRAVLHNHRRNIQFFIECNGIVIFTREFLQYDTCIELLNDLVQSSPSVVALVKQTDLPARLNDILQLHGSLSKIGQWATVALHHINSKSKDLEEHVTNSRISPKDLEKAFSFNNTSQNINGNGKHDTQDLFEKNALEMFHWKTKNDATQLISDNMINYRPTQNLYPHEKSNLASMFTDGLDLPNMENKSASLSFSFLLESHGIDSNRSILMQPRNSPIPFKKINKSTQINTGYRATLYNIDGNRKIDGCTNMLTTESHHNRPTLKDFKPKFVSTPKHSNTQRRNRISHSRISRKRQHINSIINKTFINGLHKKTNYKEQNASRGEKQQSMRARLLNVINDSCTTLMKTVTSIFKKKNDNNSPKKDFTDAREHARSFSFMNYMKERDANFRNQSFRQKSIGTEAESLNVDTSYVKSCKTCNNTILLKQKLANDQYLRQTVKRLKLGINLYGCNFKKISKMLWPQESYMTPDILYLLYRKLIIK